MNKLVGDRTYYYVKPKQKRGIAYRHVAVAAEEEKPPVAPSKILDFHFPEQGIKRSKPAPVVATLITAVVTVATLGLLYLGTAATMAYAGTVKSDLTTTAETGVTNLTAAADHLKKQDISATIKSLEAAEVAFTEARSQLSGFGQNNLYLSGLADDSFQLVTAYKLVDVGWNISTGAKSLLTDLSPVLTYFNAPKESPLAQGMVTDIVGVISSHQDSIKEAMTHLESGMQILTSIDTEAVDPQYQELIASAQSEARGLENAVMSLGTILQALPDILGYKTSRQYALLNQNNLELRATGGFIGSFALLEVYKGAVEKVSVDVSQRVDGQNKNPSIPLPAPLQKVTTSFGTRDANWFFDFAQSAKTFQDLYEEAGGGTNDGLIAINPNVLQDLLKITGPIELEDQTVSADNFLSLALAPNPGDTEHKDLLKGLAPVLLNKLLNAGPQEASALGTTLMNHLRSKDILIYFKDKKLESAIQKLNLAGGVLASQGDYLAVVRSNLGGFKSSQSVKEFIHLRPTVDLSGNIKNELKLEYRHTGSHTFPDGPNKEYVRILTPLGSRLITLEGSDYGTSVDQTEESGKTVFGFWLTVAPGEAKTVTVNYEPKISLGDTYSVLLQKQPGTSNTEAKIELQKSAGRIIQDDSASAISLFAGMLSSDIYRTVRV